MRKGYQYMNRTACLKQSQARIDEEYLCKKIIETIPSDVNLHLTIKANIQQAPNFGWGITHIVAKVESFNKNSIRFDTLAVENPDTYPFCRDREDYTYNRVALKFKYILKWEPVPDSDLPLYVGWGIKYPAYTQLLKGM